MALVLTGESAPRRTRQDAPIARPPFAFLDIREDVRPVWLSADWRPRVPLPPIAPRVLPSHNVLVWGELPNGKRLPLLRRGESGIDAAYPWADWREHILLERYATWRRRPFYTKLPFSYHRVPAGLRQRLAGRFFSARGEELPSFPTDTGFELLRCLKPDDTFRLAKQALSNEPRVVLTHDIDSQEAFDWVWPLAEVELAHGVRSSWNVVAGEYTLDEKTLDRLAENGFEIGLHDYLHDNKLIYLDETAMRRRLDRCRPFIERYGVRGFRSPSWFRGEMLYNVLQDYVDYDCSSLDFDGLCPAGPGGVLTTRPFHIGRLVEIPTTLPLEAPLLNGVSPELIPAYWEPKIEWLKQADGLAVVNSHPDPVYSGNKTMVRVYARFLARLLDVFAGRWSLPRDLSREVSDSA